MWCVCYHLFQLCSNAQNIQFTILCVVKCKFRDIRYIHTVVQPYRHRLQSAFYRPRLELGPRETLTAQPLAPTLCVPTKLTPRGVSRRGNHTVCSTSCLTYFSPVSSGSVHAVACVRISFLLQNTPCVDGPRFCVLPCVRGHGLLPLRGSCESRCCEQGVEQLETFASVPAGLRGFVTSGCGVLSIAVSARTGTTNGSPPNFQCLLSWDELTWSCCVTLFYTGAFLLLSS